MTTAYILAMDTFGPITDNAGGIAEFAHAEGGAREITDRLDAVGNTTKALTKGYAIASASLAAFLLFSAYIDKVNLIEARRIVAHVRHRAAGLGEPGRCQRVHRGPDRRDARLLLQLARDPGGRHHRAVDHRRGPTAFREMPGIMDYTQRPDYARVVDITTRAALRQMILPGMVAVARRSS